MLDRLTVGRYSLRNLFGVVTIASIIMFVLRRPLGWLLSTQGGWVMLHVWFLPNYLDLYMFGAESLWPWHTDIRDDIQVLSQTQSPLDGLLIMSMFLSLTLWILIRAWLIMAIASGIRLIFFESKGQHQ